MFRFLKFFFACLLLVQASCSADAPYHSSLIDLSYGLDARNKMDVFLPAQRDTNTETVILIHGGAWVAGDKKDFSNSDFTQRLLQNGFAVASINYRYACGDIHKQMEDIDASIRFIMSKAQEWNINSKRFALLGGSAGGHLALLYAHHFNTMQAVKAVISLAGPTDLADTLFHRYAVNYQIDYVFRQLRGTDLENNLALYRDASPLFHAGNVPSLHIHGKVRRPGAASAISSNAGYAGCERRSHGASAF